ncbi:NAD(P)H-binding protein [Amnimonas aquatica]|uniref:NAD(P)-dependent oxidoreductase n=1 Tax=Amnimonas aquatica TaxID=2094561 RepID=A0A2P6AU95_9GAMM|nr:NAD(P)H-binding protein [Amnimonas aquatica]PQA49431.1 NAD(P)-dependent oxidoreductase [Amnimonas aquatica]
MAKILIVGAGDVGGRLARLLAADGHAVWALRRHVPEDAGTPDSAHAGVAQGAGRLTWLAADVTRSETLRLPAGLDVVVTALAPGQSGSYREIYVEGTRALQQALAGQHLCRQFWVSSTSVYGEQAGEWIDETTPATAASDNAVALREAEALVTASPWPASIVRFGGLYGPGRHRLLRLVESGRPVPVEPPSWSNRLHVEDAAGFLRHLVTCALAGAPLLPCYLGVDDEPSPQHEVLTWLAARMGLPAPPGERRAAGAAQGRRIRNRALRDSGYALRYPDYRAGYAQVLAARDAAEHGA